MRMRYPRFCHFFGTSLNLLAQPLLGFDILLIASITKRPKPIGHIFMTSCANHIHTRLTKQKNKGLNPLRVDFSIFAWGLIRSHELFCLTKVVKHKFCFQISKNLGRIFLVLSPFRDDFINSGSCPIIRILERYLSVHWGS